MIKIRQYNGIIQTASSEFKVLSSSILQTNTVNVIGTNDDNHRLPIMQAQYSECGVSHVIQYGEPENILNFSNKH